MKYLEEVDPIILSGAWSIGSQIDRTLLKVVDEDHLELVDDTVYEASKSVAHKSRGGKWVRNGWKWLDFMIYN